MSHGLHSSSNGKKSACNAGDLSSIPGSGRSLEKEMAIHSSTLAWKMPWMEETGRLQSMGSQKVRYDFTFNDASNKCFYIYSLVRSASLVFRYKM